MPTSRRQVPLRVLPAFEAAARLGSFQAAAAELHLTPSAISHQIRQLEESVGVALFQRRSRGLHLTDAGRSFAATVGEVLDQLQAAADVLDPTSPPRRLLVSVPDFVAHLYVLPALLRFREHYPDLDIEINATMELTDVEAGDATAAVRIGYGRWGKLRAYLISELVGTAVAAPRLAGDAALQHGSELPVVCLRRLERHTCDTLRAAGLRIQTGRVLRMDNYMAVVQAAVEGLGVAMVYGAPGKPIELNGRLVPLSAPIPTPFAMYFVCRAHDAERPDLAALRSWLTECILG